MKWEIKNQPDGSSADIYINDVIGDWIDDYFGFGVTAKTFLKELQDLPDSIKAVRLHINSPGGDVTAAQHIANTIRDQQAHKGRTFEGLIEGAAFSAATIITSATKPTKIADNALMMTHNPWTIVVGNSAELRKAADINDKFRDTIVAAYRWKSSLSEDELIAMMDAETWMDADDAIKNGFADEKIEGVSAAAAVIAAGPMKRLPAVPDKYKERVHALLKAEEAPVTDPPAPVPAEEAAPPPPAPSSEPEKTEEEISAAATESANKRAQDILAACTKAGVPEAASDFLNRGLSADEVNAKLADASKIRARCAAAKVPERANGYIKAGMSVGEVANDLFDVMIAKQGPEIDARLTPQGFLGGAVKPGNQAQNGFDPAAINKAYQDKEKNFGRKS